MLPRLSQVGQSLGQSSVTSRCSPQHCGQMRPWTAGQKRFSLRISQIAQLKFLFSAQYYVIPDYVIPAASPDECVRAPRYQEKRRWSGGRPQLA